MFTGIVAATGRIEEAAPADGDRRIVVVTDGIDAGRMREGDSIAVQGVCVTVSEALENGFAADLSRETLSCTTLGALQAGALVNLEPALALGDALGGHFVSGHVDAIGRVLERRADARATRFVIEAPPALAPFIARKGSISVDGVGLTVNEAGVRRFGVSVIPHTLAVTTFGGLKTGGKVNLEIDLLARYIARYLEARPGNADIERHDPAG